MFGDCWLKVQASKLTKADALLPNGDGGDLNPILRRLLCSPPEGSHIRQEVTTSDASERALPAPVQQLDDVEFRFVGFRKPRHDRRVVLLRHLP